MASKIDRGLLKLSGQKDIALINIHGTLSQKADYENIRKLYRAAQKDTQINTILFDINSPGGCKA